MSPWRLGCSVMSGCEMRVQLSLSPQILLPSSRIRVFYHSFLLIVCRPFLPLSVKRSLGTLAAPFFLPFHIVIPAPGFPEYVKAFERLSCNLLWMVDCILRTYVSLKIGVSKTSQTLLPLRCLFILSLHYRNFLTSKVIYSMYSEILLYDIESHTSCLHRLWVFQGS